MDIRVFTVVRHTRNYEMMCKFYNSVLGMAVVESWDQPGNRGTVFAPAGPSAGAIPHSSAGATVEILELDGVTVRGVAPADIVLSLFVADASAAHDQLAAAGVDIARGLEDASWGHRSFGLDDPDGLRIWIVEVLPPG